MKYLNEMIAVSLEIEGLLRVIQNNPSREAEDLLAEKIGYLNDYFAAAMPQYYQMPDDSYSVQSGTPEQPIEDTPVNAVESNVVTNYQPVQDTAYDYYPETQGIPEPVTKSEIPAGQDVQVPSGTYMHPSTIGDAYTDNKMRVDEALSRKEFSDLRRAFTLNDRFRYTRELFGGSDNAFRQAINTIASLTSLEDAREFILFDLGLDENNEHVADFLNIIANHFA